MGIILVALVLLVLFGLPMLVVLAFSLATRSEESYQLLFWPPSWAQYIEALDPLYYKSYLTTLKVVVCSTSLLLVLGFPMAYWLVSLSKRARNISLCLILTPYFVGTLVTAYAWIILLRSQGSFSQFTGLDLLGTERAIILGNVANYLPLMVIPIYNSLESLGPEVLEAARNLGAKPLKIFLKILFPMSLPGVLTGITLVTFPSLGDFVIPKMLGGGMIPMLSMAIHNEFMGQISPNWPLGSAMSMLMLLILLMLKLLHKTLRGQGRGQR